MTAKLNSHVRRFIRNQLAANDPHCAYCGVYLPEEEDRTLDHVTARVRGGTNHVSNAALACEPCNKFKRDMSIDEFRLLVEWIAERLRMLRAG